MDILGTGVLSKPQKPWPDGGMHCAGVQGNLEKGELARGKGVRTRG
jgi:hypothetical protein